MMLKSKIRFAMIGLVLALPLVLASLIVVVGVSNSSILVFYLLISLEGMGILYWAISNVRMEEELRSFKKPSRVYFYPDRNRAEAIASFVKSGSKRKSYTRQVCRIELSRIVGEIFEESPAPSLKKGTSNDFAQDETELNFILNPPDTSKLNPDPSPDLDYMSSLEHVVSKLEARWY
jgi:hypothetical protein